MNQKLFTDVLFAGVDIGFGATKSQFWHEDGFNEKFVIPSMVATGRDRMLAKISTGGKDPYNPKITALQNQLNYLYVDIENLTNGESNSWFLGHLAMKEGTDQAYCWQDDKSSDKKSLALLISQLAVAQTAHEEGRSSYSRFYISTGLPIKHFRKYASTYEQNITGKWKITFNSGVWAGVTCTLHIIGCRTWPQALGIFNDQMIDLDGNLLQPDLLDDYVLVIDPGARTTEIALFKEGVMQDGYSDSFEIGMSVALDLIHEKLEKSDAKIKVKDYDLDLCFIEKNGILSTQGFEIDLKPLREEALKDIAIDIANKTKKKLGDIWESISITVVGGETGRLLYNYLELPNKRLSTNPQFGNASGYLKYAKEIAAETEKQKGLSL